MRDAICRGIWLNDMRLGRMIATCCLFGMPVAAQAQAGDRVVTPAEREQLLDREQGIRRGSFIFIPSLRGDFTYDDNIFATDTRRIDDFIANITPALAIRSDWRDKSLRADFFYTRSLYVDNTDQNVSSYGGEVAGSYNLDPQTPLTASLKAVRAVESRRNLGANRLTAEPVRFADLEGSVGASTSSGPLFLAATGRVRRLAYGDVRVAGVDVSQRGRDFYLYSGQATFGYTLRRLTRLTFDVGLERRVYDLRFGRAGFDATLDVDRTATGARFELGIQRDLTALISGTVRVGYLNFDYADPRLLDIAAFSYFGDLRWSVTPLTTISLTASRRVDETVSPTIAGNLRDEAGVGVSHELLRTLFVDGSARYAHITPTGARTDSQEAEFRLGTRYYFGRRFRFDATFNHAQRTSLDRTIAFKDNRFTLALRITP